MAAFRYRAVMPDGTIGNGEVDAIDATAALISIRRSGARPITVDQVANDNGRKRRKTGSKVRLASQTLVAELAVLLNAGLALDRALSMAILNLNDSPLSGSFGEVLTQVREGAALSSVMAERSDLFSPTAAAMAEAGEAKGELGAALSRLAEMQERSEDLRRLLVTSMIYPVALTIVAVGVILLMLLFVVPQFENLFASTKAELPPASAFVMGASRFVRDNGLWLAVGLIGSVLVLRHAMTRPKVRAGFDRLVLRLPQLGSLVQYVETARFARTLGVLIEGNVALPASLAMASRTISNSAIRAEVQKVALGVREGGGLAGPLANANVFPPMANSFFRTGEESSQLGLMLARLSDVLDRDVKIRLQRMIGILTPLITIILGVTVAGIIAAIMSAILGFNNLAVS